MVAWGVLLALDAVVTAAFVYGQTHTAAFAAAAGGVSLVVALLVLGLARRAPARRG